MYIWLNQEKEVQWVSRKARRARAAPVLSSRPEDRGAGRVIARVQVDRFRGVWGLGCRVLGLKGEHAKALIMTEVQHAERDEVVGVL